MALFNNFPYTDLNDINLDYTLQKLESLYTRGEQLYSTLTTWQQATDAELEQWKAATESSLALWKTQTENSIDNKIQLLTAAINTAFTELRSQLEAHIAEIETTAVNAASDASASATAAAGAASAASINNEQSKEWAIGETLEGDPVPDTNPAYENNAKYYADLLGQETEQIDQNTADITDLKSAITGVEYSVTDIYSTKNVVYDRLSNTGSSFLSATRLYILDLPVNNIVNLSCTTSDNSDITLYICEKTDSGYNVKNKITKTPVNNAVTFENVYITANCYVALSGKVSTRTDILKITLYATDLTNISNDFIANADLQTISTLGLVISLEYLTLGDNYINPDDYTGTDTQKLQQAFDAVSTSGGVIKIARKYAVADVINISHVYSANHRIYVIGDTNNAEINMSVYGAYFMGAAGNTGGIVFRGIKFTGTASGRIMSCGSGSVGNNNKTLCGMIFDNCVISNVGYVAESNHYLQSLTITNSTLREITSIVSNSGQILYAVNIQNCIIEAAKIGIWAYCEACNIINNVIEGISGIPITITDRANALRIEGNYFESNNTNGSESTSIKMTFDSGAIRNIKISSNYFYDGTGHAIVLADTTGASSGVLIIGNSVLGDSYLIGGNSSITYTDVLAVNNSGSITDLPNTSLKNYTIADILTKLAS